MNCFRCDTPLGPRDAFCPECGSRPDEQAPPLDLGGAYEAARPAPAVTVMEPPTDAYAAPVEPPVFPGIEAYRQRLRDLLDRKSVV